MTLAPMVELTFNLTWKLLVTSILTGYFLTALQIYKKTFFLISF